MPAMAHAPLSAHKAAAVSHSIVTIWLYKDPKVGTESTIPFLFVYFFPSLLSHFYCFFCFYPNTGLFINFSFFLFVSLHLSLFFSLLEWGETESTRYYLAYCISPGCWIMSVEQWVQ
jgi:hypothetical protein